jgi:hypothetical protein
MTRLNNEMRDHIRIKIMAGLPNVDYLAQIKALVQNTILEFAPKQAQELYADENTKPYLQKTSVELRGDWGGSNKYVWLHNIYGTKQDLSFNIDPRVEVTLKEGSLVHALYTRLHESGLINKHKDQIILRDSVVKRLRSNLQAATTIKRLYTILEPELHGYIPREADPVSNLPATVAPVVDDLRKLGAKLPEGAVK